MINLLPTGFGYTRDFTFESHFPETDAAKTKSPINGMRPTTVITTSIVSG